ncbi:hypothetical protein BGW80DRAFT_1369931 [Lactifluus volemus]|nr:hypothetical protein BGW80DRAFT_1369931 [Lactifluus volemus]
MFHRLVAALVNLHNRHGILSRPRRPVTEYICAQRLGIRVRSCGSAEQAFARRNERPRSAMVAFQRTVGPAAAASLFAFSLANDVLSGNFVYVVLIAFVCVALCVAAQLPRHTCKHGER